MASDDDDPVRAAFRGREDLYDIATWEVRSRLDRFAVSVWQGLARTGRWALVSIAVGLFVAELAITGLLISNRPILGPGGPLDPPRGGRGRLLLAGRLDLARTAVDAGGSQLLPNTVFFVRCSM